MYSPYAKVISNPSIGPYGKRTYRYANPRRAAQARKRYRARKTVVPRTMGPFAVSESKYFDSEFSAFTIGENTAAWAATNDVVKGVMVLPQEGSDIDNRIGRKISLYKLAIRGIISHGGASDQADILPNDIIRIILWMDTQTNATVTTSGSLMRTPTNATAPILFTQFQNLSNLGRFRVLKDVVVRCPPSTSGTDGANTTSQAITDIPFKFTIKFRKPVTIRFNSTNGGTIGDIVDNSFYLSMQASRTGGYTTTTSGTCRSYYKDA